jgi:glycosyltransferase involved in cell wall biosynthesis
VTAAPCRWSIIIPYYNEERFIARTILSALGLEGGPHRLILVNNGSSDASPAMCRSLLRGQDRLDVVYLDEARPGPVHALHTGFAAVTTPFVSLWNADTWYPADYLLKAEALLAQPNVVAAMATGFDGSPDALYPTFERYRTWAISRLWTRQAHTGTYGHNFLTDALRAAGGPRSDAWPYVLDDHELMHRVFKFGEARHARDFWCVTSDRRNPTADVRWSLYERLIYHFTPYAAKDWFFYDWLAGRFAARGMLSANLRRRNWEEAPTPSAPLVEEAPVVEMLLAAE